MIKINLAKKKQASYSGSESSSKTATSGLFKGMGDSVSSGDLSGIMVRIMLPLVLCVISYFGFNYFIELKTEELQIEVSNVEKEKIQIQTQLKKISGFEKQKVELEKTAQVINVKINTIEQLIRGKDHTVKALIALSQSLPKDVWITDISATEKSYNIKGSTLDMSLVSDVMSKLGSSIYYKDVSLKGSVSDASGRQATFELTARRE